VHCATTRRAGFSTATLSTMSAGYAVTCRPATGRYLPGHGQQGRCDLPAHSPLVCMLFVLTMLITTSCCMRCVFARDHGLSFSAALPRSIPPSRSRSTLSCGLRRGSSSSASSLGSSNAFNAIVAASVVALGVTYAVLPTINRLRGRRMLPKSRLFKLNNFVGWTVNLIGIAWTVLITVLFLFQPETPLGGPLLHPQQRRYLRAGDAPPRHHDQCRHRASPAGVLWLGIQNKMNWIVPTRGICLNKCSSFFSFASGSYLSALPHVANFAMMQAINVSMVYILGTTAQLINLVAVQELSRANVGRRSSSCFLLGIKGSFTLILCIFM
jgi:hypothetical protein